MRYLRIFTSGILCVLLFACNNNTRTDEEIIKIMEENLTSSNQSLNFSTQTSLWKLEDKLSDFRTQHKAEIWHRKAKRISEISQEYFNYIEQLKKEVALTEDRYLSLFEKLNQYNLDVLNVDSLIYKHFPDASFIKTDSSNNSEKKSFTSIFAKASIKSTKAFLTKLQNDIRIFENKTILFCNEQVGSTITYFQTYSAIVAQSSKIVEPGNEIDITAGIGSFSKAALPRIIINGKDIPLDDYGKSNYKIKSPDKPGKYKLPVEIRFIDENGEKQTITSRIEYTVAKICNE